MKYYVIRTSLVTGRTEYRGNKRGKYWNKQYAEEHADMVPTFTKRSAQAICSRAEDTWHWKYEAIPVQG